MKGLLFTELLEMVEEDFGYHTANAIVTNASLSSKGIYTASRRYHRAEMSRLFEQLQRQTRLSFDQLSTAFGRRLCKQILTTYPQQQAYIRRVFLRISRQSRTSVFEYSRYGTAGLAVVYDPSAGATCLTDGMIKGYLTCLQQQNKVLETTLPDGKRKFTLTF